MYSFSRFFTKPISEFSTFFDKNDQTAKIALLIHKHYLAQQPILISMYYLDSCLERDSLVLRFTSRNNIAKPWT